VAGVVTRAKARTYDKVRSCFGSCQKVRYGSCIVLKISVYLNNSLETVGHGVSESGP
jgi:hypothetical protein